MDNHKLSLILRKIQDQLNEDDRRRLIVILSQEKVNSPDLENLLPSPIDVSQLNETQVKLLLKFFEEVHCNEGVNLFKNFEPSSSIPSTNCKPFPSLLLKSTLSPSLF